ncbi:MAG TPA: hypothetical protein VI790_04685 [Candidatus Nanoarchaeia archaeon]|nr:hypothetical protein [Candidatus Nanoarchaeia archaeon]
MNILNIVSLIIYISLKREKLLESFIIFSLVIIFLMVFGLLWLVNYSWVVLIYLALKNRISV